jgi:hypothetical protein
VTNDDPKPNQICFRKTMKAANPNLAKKPQPPVFQKTLHQLRANPIAADASSKSEKRDNTFSKSRDTREDRGTREMKTSHNSQTMPHAR